MTKKNNVEELNENSVELEEECCDNLSADEENESDLIKKELEEQKDLFLRKVAEFENYKKRTQREAERIGMESRASVIKKLLPALDNFDRAVAVENASNEDFRKGIEITIKQLIEVITDLGVEKIEPNGEPFDPEYHYAVSQVEDESLGENIVAQVMQCGYKMGDIVIRPAMVSVANCN